MTDEALVRAACGLFDAAFLEADPPEGACPTCWQTAWAWTVSGQKICARCLNLPPGFGAACRPLPVAPEAAAAVRAIEAEALALGWTREELWQNAGWFGARGLAGVLHPGWTIEEVAADAITLRTREGHRLRFYRKARLN